MNIDSLVTQLGSQLSTLANNAQTAASGDVANDPQQMLQAQYAMQQYNVMVGYESALMKSVKDMMMGIIAKI